MMTPGRNGVAQWIAEERTSEKSNVLDAHECSPDHTEAFSFGERPLLGSQFLRLGEDWPSLPFLSLRNGTRGDIDQKYKLSVIR